MTRINAGIPPIALDDWRLIAEINEMPRVVEVYKNRIEKNINFGDIPKKFTLGEGHVKFFLNKGMYIYNRYNQLVDEFNMRGLFEKIGKDQITIDSTIFFQFKDEHFKDYSPREYDKQLVVTRIIESIREKNKDTWYYGKQEKKEVAIKRISAVAEPIKMLYKQEKLF